VPDRRGSRFVFEVLFLVALAVGLTVAKVSPLEIAGIMLLGWVIVALLEWAAWRGEPHYGSGLPPRYYVPRVSLPPAQPLEQVPAGYPGFQRDDAPTWIASADLRAEMLEEWPSVAPAQREQESPLKPVVTEDTQPEQVIAIVLPDRLPEPEPEPEPEPAALVHPVPVQSGPVESELVRSGRGVARYSLDPLAEPPRRRRFRGGADAIVPSIEVPARPGGVRALPGSTPRED
jgi:hypothetical protein